MNNKVVFGDFVTFSEDHRASLLNGASKGKKITAPNTLIDRWTSQTPSDTGFPVAKAASITSKTVPMFAPRTYGKM
jgi:hypothetical protein